MPTADDYYQGAVDWENAAYQLDVLSFELAWSFPEAMIGQCPVRGWLDSALGVSLQNVLQSARDFRELKAECARRQAVCAEFDAAMSSYRSRLDQWSATTEQDRGPQPSAPLPPFAWVEASS